MEKIFHGEEVMATKQPAAILSTEGKDVTTVELAEDGIYKTTEKEIINPIEAALGDRGAVVLPLNGFTVTTDELSKKIFADIGNIFSKEADINFKVYFKTSDKDTKVKYSIDNSVFTPKPITRIGGNFEKKYLKQLDSILHNETDDLDESGILGLFLLYRAIDNGDVPIQIRSNTNQQLLSKIVSAMNHFFNENKTLIRSMYIMFNSNMDSRNKDREV